MQLGRSVMLTGYAYSPVESLGVSGTPKDFIFVLLAELYPF